MLMDATSDLDSPISIQSLCQWQAALFPEPPLLRILIIGQLRGEATMQVLSQKSGRAGLQETVQFEAPPQSVLQSQLSDFITFFNHNDGLTPQQRLIRSAISHLWLIILHPFDDGNDRVARPLTDRALAQAEKNSIRFYSLSAAIESNRKDYYQILEDTQSCKTQTQLQAADKVNDITEWISWFLKMLAQAMQQGLERIKHVIEKSLFWNHHSQTPLSER